MYRCALLSGLLAPCNNVTNNDITIITATDII